MRNCGKRKNCKLRLYNYQLLQANGWLLLFCIVIVQAAVTKSLTKCNFMKYYSFCLLSVVIICSCSKNTSDIPDTPFIPNTSSLVKKIIEDRSGTFAYHYEYSFNYDNLNRISEIHSDVSDIDFEYVDNVIKKNVYPAGSAPEHYFYYYNTDSLLDSSVSVIDTLSIHTSYIYNSAGQVIQRIEKTINNKNSDTIDTYVYPYKYDAKGNITFIERYFVTYADSISISNDRFEFSDTVNFITSADIMYPDKVSRNANLVKEEHHDSYYMPSAFSHHYYYKYEFDEHKRIKVITIEEKDPLSNIINTITYTYIYL